MADHRKGTLQEMMPLYLVVGGGGFRSDTGRTLRYVVPSAISSSLTFGVVVSAAHIDLYLLLNRMLFA
ncbi:hypothetical protein LSCM4_01513 [Leishmania orientalis]|uniref:Uncharacterized protein n=1 Tax=Leishmania orientalis TaxID=2249476 RepID=A0A836GY45_9TRYP|nr:hypothetical protein LSCM4_01513 [Leishmania orientalis]